MAQSKDPEITWKMSLERANAILSIVARGPYDQVSEIMTDLQAQARGQILQIQQQQQMAALAARSANGEAIEVPK